MTGGLPRRATIFRSDGAPFHVALSSDETQLLVSGPTDSALVPVEALMAGHWENGPAGEAVVVGDAARARVAQEQEDDEGDDGTDVGTTGV